MASDHDAPGRIQPQDLDAEQSVLGAILLDEDALGRIAPWLSADDFYRKNHAEVYRAALGLFTRGEPVDIVTVGAALEEQGVLSRLGGRTFLSQLEESCHTAANVEYHARIVRDRATKRHLITAGGAISGLGFDAAVDAGEAISLAQQKILGLSDDQVTSDPQALAELIPGYFAALDTGGEGHVKSVKTGFTDLDYKLGGLKPAQLILVCGRPGMGKTSLGLNIALRAASARTPTLIFSLEMSKEELVTRFVAQKAEVDGKHLDRCLHGDGQLTDDEMEKVAAAIGPLSDYPLIIDDQPSMSEAVLVSKARRVAAMRGDLGLIVVDYIQLVRGSGEYQGSRVNEVGDVTRALKGLAKDLALPVVGLSQLSRAPEMRSDKRPVLADLRDSGNLEQDADIVIAVYRESYYKRDESDMSAEAIILKHRNGEQGTVDLLFRPELTRFDSVDRRYARGAVA